MYVVFFLKRLRFLHDALMFAFIPSSEARLGGVRRPSNKPLAPRASGQHWHGPRPEPRAFCHWSKAFAMRIHVFKPS